MNPKTETPKIALVCSCGSDVGYKAFNRCLTLAESMQRLRLCEPVLFLSPGTPEWKKAQGLASTIVPLEKFESGRPCLREVLTLSVTQGVDGIVLDLLDSPDPHSVTELVDRKTRVFLVDGFGPASFRADLTFFQAASLPERIAADPRWTESPFGYVAGPETLILRSKFRKAKAARPESRQLRILISMGEQDPTGSTPRVLTHLARIERDFRMTPVIGPLFKAHAELDRSLRRIRRKIDVARAVPDMSALMDLHDLAFVSYGTTAFELAARGVPALLVSHTEADEEAARLFEKLGTSRHLGCVEGLGGEIESEGDQLLRDRALRQKLARSGPAAIDGRGADRVATRIRDCVLSS